MQLLNLSTWHVHSFTEKVYRKITIYTSPICTRRILLEFKCTFQYVMDCLWNAHHLSLCEKISQFSFYNIASFSVIHISDYRFEIVVLNGPFFVGFNWFCWPLSVSEVSHNLLVMLLTIFNCCYSYEYEVPLYDIPVHIVSWALISWKYSTSVVSLYF